MIATQFTADQLVVSPTNATGTGEDIAKNTIALCKLIQHAYPDARFAVDGRHSRYSTNEIDYRGRVDVFASHGGEWAGLIDVSRINGVYRYRFEGPYVESKKTRHYNGHVWRKDAIKLVEVIQADNCLRGKNPGELYREARSRLISSATGRLSHTEEYARFIVEMTRKEALGLAFGRPASPNLQNLLTAARAHWKGIVADVQADLDRQHEELLAQYGVEGWEPEATERSPNLKAVLASF